MSPLNPWWVVGFVDGEGCFSVDLITNPTLALECQAQANFSVTQGLRSRSALERIQAFFGCGQIQANKRRDNHREDLGIYRVRKLADLQQVIIPFFQHYPLQTAKAQDFALFVEVVARMGRGEYLALEGLEAIRQLKGRMHRPWLSDEEGEMESSETIRQAPS